MQSAPNRYWENSDVDKSQREHDQHVHMSLDSLNIYVYIYPLVFFYRFAPINHDSDMIHHPKPSSYLRQPGAVLARYGNCNLVRAWRVALSETMILPKTRFLKVPADNGGVKESIGKPWENWGLMGISWEFN